MIVELPASIAFFLNPSMTLSQSQPHAHAVIRQYALLLMSSNIIAYNFIFRSPDETSASVAAALAVYHVGPLLRAGARVGGGEARGQSGGGFSSPWVHLIAHLVCLVSLVYETLQGI